jgi:hypothetical protein
MTETLAEKTCTPCRGGVPPLGRDEALRFQAQALAWTAELLPNPPVTRNQVELMQVDNVCSPGMPGFAELGISPHSVENMLEQTLRSR